LVLLPIPVHFVCETLAYFLGYRYYAYLRKNTHDQISANNRLVIFIGAAFGAFLGSHVVGVLENPTLLSGLTSSILWVTKRL
jgi:phosphatidylglycerol:prolipoprotein diacylglycerol transferase